MILKILRDKTAEKNSNFVWCVVARVTDNEPKYVFLL